MNLLALWQYLGKKTFLGLKVIFHSQMIIKMFMSEISKHAQIKIAIVNPFQVNGVRRNFGDDMSDAIISHRPEYLLHFIRFRSCVGGGICFIIVTVIYRA